MENKYLTRKNTSGENLKIRWLVEPDSYDSYSIYENFNLQGDQKKDLNYWDEVSFEEFLDLPNDYKVSKSCYVEFRYFNDNPRIVDFFENKENSPLRDWRSLEGRLAILLNSAKSYWPELAEQWEQEEKFDSSNEIKMESGQNQRKRNLGFYKKVVAEIIEFLAQALDVEQNYLSSQIFLCGGPNYDEESRSKHYNEESRSKPMKKLDGSRFVNDYRIESLNVIFEGVAGCGKTYYQKSLFNSQDVNGQLGFNPERSETVVFHPSTSYEDFVSGLRPLKNGNFTGKAGIFVELCNRAAADPKNNYLLFIDEINRANTAKVFGDLLMVIEEAKRTPKELLSKYGRAVLTRQEAKELQLASHEAKDPDHATVRLQTAVDAIPGTSESPEEPLEYLAVPDNLYIVGTMNSTDRSVGTIDLALRRRFTWHTMEPMTAEELLGKDKVNDRDDLDELNSLLGWYDEANAKLYTKVGPDARLGHSYFFQDDKTAQQIAHDLLKQLAEIAYIFHLEDLMTESPFNQTINGLRLEMPGDGLGKRVIVAFAPTSPDTETPDGGAEPLESSDESSESLADEG